MQDSNQIDYRWFVWLLGWLVVVGMYFAECSVFNQPIEVLPIVYAAVLWPFAIGWYIYKALF